MTSFNSVDISGAYFCHCSFPERGFSGKLVGDLPVNKYTKVRPKAKKSD